MSLLVVKRKPLLSHFLKQRSIVNKRRNFAQKPYFVTTPIFYVNADEHGLKVQKAAESQRLKPIELCDKNSSRFKHLCECFHISNDDFIRTSEERHRTTVEAFWNVIDSNGYIYKDSYKGWYCASDEAFVSELNIGEVKKDSESIKVSLESGNPVEWCEEQNYMFPLSSFKDKLLNWMLSDTERVKPKKFYDYLVHMIKETTKDISISRPSSRIHWGIRVPGDDTQTIYVWLDALINYLTVCGYPNHHNSLWPANCHVIGKDILKFHGLYWPAFLLAAGINLPERIVCHSHWTIDELKMSKSKGNVIDPFAMANTYTSEGFRYYLYLNDELANCYGNLLNRCSAATINKSQCYPSTPKYGLFYNNQFKTLVDELETLSDECKTHFEDANFYLGVDAIVHCLRNGNKLFQEFKPWELVKNENEKETLDCVIYTIFETLRICSILLQPIIPLLTERVLTKLNIPKNERTWNHAKPCFLPTVHGKNKSLGGGPQQFGSHEGEEVASVSSYLFGSGDRFGSGDVFGLD
ncbi:methionyl-tRNA synthetase-like protein [Dinothrombium tinctorium]|uniref:Methionine--tRNA ligase, mitochondrial n=1 Tax=Dinothrombium tinctorium TaxID=1965070 RepID=A0A3S3PLK7_9ACAR|nr:methionyl-tRNA synthetase-like protein [Dinothrombium tinctorium]